MNYASTQLLSRHILIQEMDRYFALSILRSKHSSLSTIQEAISNQYESSVIAKFIVRFIAQDLKQFPHYVTKDITSFEFLTKTHRQFRMCHSIFSPVFCQILRNKLTRVKEITINRKLFIKTINVVAVDNLVCLQAIIPRWVYLLPR